MRPSAPEAMDQLFQALANPTRRAVVARLGLGPATVSDLAAPFGMALASFCQHLDVLEKAGVIRSMKQGRVRTCALAPEALEAGERWLADQRSLWTRRLDQLEDHLLNDPEFR